MVSVRRIRRVALALFVASLACLLVAFLRRHSYEDSSGLIEGAYFNRSVGAPAYAGIFGSSVLDPFRPLNSYLWVGAAIAFAVTSAALALLARFGRIPSH